MDSRTQWELAGVTLATVICAGTYGLGVNSSRDTVTQLEKSLASYEKSDKVNTEEFIDSVVSTTSALELTMEERISLRKQEVEITELNEKLAAKNNVIKELELSLNEQSEKTKTLVHAHEKLLAKIAEEQTQAVEQKDQLISQLNIELEKLKAYSFPFELAKGQGANIKEGKFQVGVSDISTSNKCNVSINNEHKIMSAGDYVQADNCKITITECDFFSRDPVKFEMVCSGENKI